MDALPTPKIVRDSAEAVGLSMSELCRRAKIAPSTFWKWQAGEHSPKLSVIQKWLSVIEEAKNDA